MNGIKNHCHTYQQHLSNFYFNASDSVDPIGAMKKTIVTDLLEKNNPFVKKLQFLCEQASPKAQIELSSVENSNHLASLMNNPENDYKSLVPQFNLKPRRALTTSTATQSRILSDAAWDEILADSAEILPQGETTYSQFGFRV